MIKSGLYNFEDTIVDNTFTPPTFFIESIIDGASAPLILDDMECKLVIYKDTLCTDVESESIGYTELNRLNFNPIISPSLSGQYYFKILIINGTEIDDFVHGKIKVKDR